jgi:hypothetical protein
MWKKKKLQNKKWKLCKRISRVLWTFVVSQWEGWTFPQCQWDGFA